mgnify:CR=1 FL=1
MNIIIFGPPGAGKGTQAKFLVEKLRSFQVSTGEMLRDEIQKDTDIGKKIINNMNDGKFVEDEIVNKLLEKTIFDLNKKNKLIFDGYPRTINQAKNLETLLNKSNPLLWINWQSVNRNNMSKIGLGLFASSWLNAEFSIDCLNLSKQILQSFGTMNEELTETNVELVDRNEQFMQGLEEKAQEQAEKYLALKMKADSIRNISTGLYNYLENIKEGAFVSAEEKGIARSNYSKLDNTAYYTSLFFWWRKI